MTDRELENAGYTHLGWVNGWREQPQALKDCNHSFPDRQTIHHSPRGTDTTVICHRCRWYYKVDSGD